MTRSELVRRDPFLQDLMDFRNSFDDIFTRFYRPLGSSAWRQLTEQAWVPPVETYMEGNRFHIRVAIPGVDPKKVNLQVHGNEIQISGEHQSQSQPSDDKFIHREFTYGRFERAITLPEAVEVDKIEANYQNGVLTFDGAGGGKGAATPHRDQGARRIRPARGGQQEAGLLSGVGRRGAPARLIRSALARPNAWPYSFFPRSDRHPPCPRSRVPGWSGIRGGRRTAETR